MPSPSLTLNHLLRLDQQLRRDQDLPLRELQERDRALGRELAKSSAQVRSPALQLGTWLERIAPAKSVSFESKDEGMLRPWLSVVGLIAGVMSMSGLLLVDAKQPVNVLMLLAIFVGLQLLLLLLTLISAFSTAAASGFHLPFESLNPLRLLFRRGWKRTMGNLRWEAVADVARLALLREGQRFGIAFNIGGIAALLSILAVVDRSFGWSSTFDISQPGLHQLLQIVAAPWSNWLPAAEIDQGLIAATRYQSLQTEFSSEQLRAMNQWWPFLLACLVCYGLLPRLILFFVFRSLYQGRLTKAFVHYPGADLVLERMNSPAVDTRAKEHELGEPNGVTPTANAVFKPEHNGTLISWAGAVERQQYRLLEELGFRTDDIPAAGISLREDKALQDQLAHQNAERTPRSIVIAVKSWEPPLAELGDFIAALPPSINCHLLLLPLNGRGINSDELRDWRRFVASQSRPLNIMLGSSADEGRTQ